MLITPMCAASPEAHLNACTAALGPRRFFGWASLYN